MKTLTAPPFAMSIASAPKRSCTSIRNCPTSIYGALIATAMAFAPTSARAVDGCLVLLCFAAPSWRAIPQCVPPVVQVLADLALGRPFPTCDMAGQGNTATHQWSRAPDFCPPQYTLLVNPRNIIYACGYKGAVTVEIDGAFWSRTWWSMRGDTVTEYAESAKESLGTWETQYEDDYAVWLATQPPACEEDC